MELIVGVDGMIGHALLCAMREQGLDPAGTSRRHGTPHHFLDLETLLGLDELPRVRVAYVCAGVVGYKNCEGNPSAMRVNVDGTLALIKRLRADGAFIVFMSSDAVEHMLTTSYGMQKALVEMYLQTECSATIIRSGRVERNMLPELCELLLSAGKEQIPGVVNFIPGGSFA